MADILICGFSMPNGCGVCPLNTGAFYCAGLRRYVIEEEHVWMGSNYRRLKDCPLVELPEHGELKDARQIREQIDDIWDGRPLSPIGAKVLAVIDSAPIVVTASKEETE